MGAEDCQQCGSPLGRGAETCPRCGAPVPAVEPVQAPARRQRRVGRLVVGTIVIAALVATAAFVVHGDIPSPPGPAVGGVGGGPVGLAPHLTPGPDLGDAWTTAPDPKRFITIDGGSKVAADQYLVMLSGDTSETAARRVAASGHGTLVGHVAYVGLWKVHTTAAKNAAAWYRTRDKLATTPGVDVIAPVSLVTTQAAPDCAPNLHNAVYSGDGAKPYDMIGVTAAWQAYYASGLPKRPVHLGIIDTALTRDPAGKIPWQFSEVTFDGAPLTTPTPRPTTATDPRADGFNHATASWASSPATAATAALPGSPVPSGRTSRSPRPSSEPAPALRRLGTVRTGRHTATASS